MYIHTQGKFLSVLPLSFNDFINLSTVLALVVQRTPQHSNEC